MIEESHNISCEAVSRSGPESVLQGLLDSAHRSLEDSKGVEAAMSALRDGLWNLRSSVPLEAWRRLAKVGVCHPICSLLHEDPLTSWAYQKPRGYPGDAVCLDHMYGEGEIVRERLRGATPRGRAIYEWILASPAGVGMRHRRDRLATILDDVSIEVEAPHVLSVACGHLREAPLSRAVRAGRVARFVALDQDPETIALVRKEQSHLGVEAVVGTVKDIMARRCRPGTFDQVYAAGLYDYLPLYFGQVLLEVLFEMLNPGGRVVIVNGLTKAREAGYMEMFADWNLVYREVKDLEEMTARLPPDQVADQRIWIQESEHFGYLEVRRR